MVCSEKQRKHLIQLNENKKGKTLEEIHGVEKAIVMRKKISDTINELYANGFVHGMLGKKQSKESIKKNIDTQTKNAEERGYWLSKETIEKQKETRKIKAIERGHWYSNPEERGSKISKAKKGVKRKPFSEEWRKNMSKANKGRKNLRKGMTFEEYYGIERAKELKLKDSKALKEKMKDPEFRRNTLGIRVSRPQKQLFKMVQNIIPEAELEKHIKTKDSCRFADIYIPVYNIIIEYDGLDFHKNIQHDKQRDGELNEFGYKILHYRGYLPSDEELRNDINLMINSVFGFMYKRLGKDITNEIINYKNLKNYIK